MSFPEPLSTCEVCDEEPFSTGLLRCSTCKNKFYCSVSCQREDWKKHKMDCSLLPSAELPLANICPSEEMDAEVRRVAALLQAVQDSWKDLDAGLSAQDLRKAKRTTTQAKELSALQLPSEFAFTTNLKLNRFHLAVVSISRLFFLHDIAHMSSPQETDELLKLFKSCQFPSSFPQLYGPKLLARPGDLSPGEYEMLIQVLPVHYTACSQNDDTDERMKERADRWLPLMVIFKC